MAKKPLDDVPQIQRHQVTLDPDLARKVGVIAAALGVRIQDWVNSRLTVIADRELEATMEEMGFEPRPVKK